MNGTDWESVCSKYSDILELFKKVIPEIEEGSWLLKDYTHQKEKVTKEIITAKLKAMRTKFRQVCVSVSLCIGLSLCVYLSLSKFAHVCVTVWLGIVFCWCRLWIEEGEVDMLELYIDFMICVKRYGVAVQQLKDWYWRQLSYKIQHKQVIKQIYRMWTL